MSTETCVICDTDGAVLERVRYYPRQLVTASVLTTDQEYARHKARQHNRCLHGWGVVCGLEVKANPSEEQPWRVTVCPGCLVDPLGNEIAVAAAVDFDLATQASEDPCAGAPPCPPTGTAIAGGNDGCVYLVACYKECYSRPERVPPLGCGCDESACEYARIREGFELGLRFALPESHVRASKADEAWCEQIKRWARSSDIPGPLPVPPCPECPADPCVVIARICLPEATGGRIGDKDISYDGRRVLYGVSALRMFSACS